MNCVPQEELRLLHAGIEEIVVGFTRLASESAGDFACVEEAARVAILQLREALMSAGLRLSASRSQRTHHCPSCGGVLCAWSLSERRVVTAEGEATYFPLRYRCKACAQDFYPLEEANGLHGSSYTTGAKAVIAETGAEQPFAHVSYTLSLERGLTVSPKEVDRTVREVAGWRAEEEAELAASAYGPEAALLRAQDTDPLAQAPSLHGFTGWPADAPALISVDGAMIRSTIKGPEGLEWFECRAGVLRSVGDGTHAATFYTGGVCTPDALFDQLGASWQKAVPPGRDCVFVADGARWIWDRVRLHFPAAVQVLDYYHACEHIGSAAAAWRGERTPEAITWRQNARKTLIEPDGASAVLRTLLDALRKPEQVVNPQELRKEIRYLFGHRHRMRYHHVKSRGLPIGSGAMESGIKQMTTARLRMPGMKWTREGADAVLKVRGAHLSNSLRLTTDRRHAALQIAATERYRMPGAMAA